MAARSGRIFYGWYITAATWLSYMALACVAANCGAVINAHSIVDRGWNEGIVGILNSCLYASVAFFAIPAGKVAKQKGCRYAFTVGAVVQGLIFLTVFLMDAPVPLYIGAHLLLGLPIAFGGQVTAPILVDSWFDKRKSEAMAAVITAGGIAGFFLPALTEAIYGLSGLRGCWIAVSIIGFSALLPIRLVFRDRPEEIGEVKDGINWTRTHSSASAGGKKETGAVRKYASLKEAYLSKEFIMVSIINTVYRTAQTTFIGYALLHMMRSDLPTRTGVTIIVISNIFSLAGRVLVSFTGRSGIPYRLWTLAQFVIMAPALCLFAFSGNYLFFLLTGVMIGFTTGFMTAMVPLLLSDSCGNQYYNEQYGMLNTICFACMIAAPLLISFLTAVTGAYTVSFLILAALSVVCGVCAWML